MLGSSKPKPIPEHEAEGEIEQIYHEIRQVLRVTGVNLNFRTWAGFDKFFPIMWRAMRPNLETRAFEHASDRVRAQAAEAAVSIGKVNAAEQALLGPSQSYQVRAALLLYHYINPKLLVLISAVRLALDEEQSAEADINSAPELIQRGIPPQMYPMEMIEENPGNKRVKQVFDDIKKTLSLSSLNSDYRTLGLWPSYLASSWERLKPVTQTEFYHEASGRLRDTAGQLSRHLPYPILLCRKQIEEAGENVEAVVKTTEQFEKLLPPLILNMALLAQDWISREQLTASPFPAPIRQIGGRS